MKLTTIAYALLGAVGLVMSIALPVALYNSGSASVPFWIAVASPGPLSATHDFLHAQCETCHTPVRGVKAASCVTCHITAAQDLVTKPSTAFHANIGECAGCHVEHQGRDRRPINMDHAVLAAAGHAHAGKSEVRGPDNTGFRHVVAWLRILFAGSGADLAGGSLATRPLPAETRAALDCSGCHANNDPHRTLFGRDCQGCHNVDKWAISTFRHPSPRSQDCVQCHQAPPSHYMMHFEMMDRMMTGQANARVEQCFLCHQTDSFNNLKGIGWFKMH